MSELEKQMKDQVDDLRRKFEIYKDEVQRLDDTCEAYSRLVKMEQAKVEALNLILLKVKHVAETEGGTMEDIQSILKDFNQAI